MKNDSRRKSGCFKFLLKSTASIIILSISIPIILILPLNKINPYITSIQIQRTAEFLIKEKKLYYKRQWIDIENISPYMKRAVIAAEDARFFYHDGIDLIEAEKAIEDYSEGKRKRGASTISMQLVKNLYLWDGVTEYDKMLRKGIEVYLTLWLEMLVSKERILEIYLNVVEWGKGIYGIGSASQFYYNTNAKKLTRSQSAHLAAVLPAPLRHTPGDNSRFTNKRAAIILSRI